MLRWLSRQSQIILRRRAHSPALSFFYFGQHSVFCRCCHAPISYILMYITSFVNGYTRVSPRRSPKQLSFFYDLFAETPAPGKMLVVPCSAQWKCDPSNSDESRNCHVASAVAVDSLTTWSQSRQTPTLDLVSGMGAS